MYCDWWFLFYLILLSCLFHYENTVLWSGTQYTALFDIQVTNDNNNEVLIKGFKTWLSRSPKGRLDTQMNWSTDCQPQDELELEAADFFDTGTKPSSQNDKRFSSCGDYV
jgi:hypothetical protein